MQRPPETPDDRSVLDVHALSLHGHGPNQDHDQFAVADIAKSMRLHASSLSVDDATRVHGDSQGHVFLLIDRLTDSRLRPRTVSAVDRLVDYFVNDLPWTHLTRGDAEDVGRALEEAVRDCRAELHALEGATNDLSLTLAFVDWPELYVVRLGEGRAVLVRGRQAIDVAAGEPHDPAPCVEHRSLEHDDVLVVLNGAVGGTADVLGTHLRVGERGTAEALCSELLRGELDEDRTAIVARFVPPTSLRAAERSAPPDRLAAHARPPVRHSRAS